MPRRLLALLILCIILAAVVAVTVVRPSPVVRTVVTGGQPVAVAVDPVTRRAFVADTSGRVHVLDTVSGRLVRTAPLDGTGWPSHRLAIAIDARSGRVYVAGDGPPDGLDVLDARDGRSLGVIPGGAGARYLAVDEETGRVFVGEAQPQPNEISAIEVLDEASGRVTQAVPGGTNLLAIDGFGGGPMAVDEAAGRVFAIGAYEMNVLASRGGIGLASVPLAPGNAAIAVAPRLGRAFLSDGSGTHMLDAHTGAVLHTVPAGAGAVAIAVDEGANRVFLAIPANYNRKTGALLSGGSVVMLDAHSGAVLRTLSGGFDPVAMAVDARHHRVVVVNRNGLGVRLLDSRSGDDAGRAQVGVNPAAVAVDARTGRAFVVASGGTEQAPDPWAWLLDPLHHVFAFIPGPASHIRHGPGNITVIAVENGMPAPEGVDMIRY